MLPDVIMLETKVLHSRSHVPPSLIGDHPSGVLAVFTLSMSEIVEYMLVGRQYEYEVCMKQE